MPRGINDYDEGRIQGRNVANANSSNIVSPGIVTDGLVLHLDAGNYESYPRAGTTWYDLSDRLNNGTLTNGPTFNSESGGSIVFDAVDDYVDISPIGLTKSFTIFGFLYRQSISGAQVFFGEDSGSATGGPKIAFNNNANQISVRIVTTAESIAAPGIQTWICVAITRDSANKVDAYVNSDAPIRLFSDVAQVGTFTFNRLGSNGLTVSQLFNGRIAKVLTYDRALTPTEVAQNFNATRARFNI